MYFKEQGIFPVIVTRHWDRKIETQSDTFLPTRCQKKTQIETEHGLLIQVPYNPGFRDKILIRHGEKRFSFFRQSMSLAQSILQFFSFRFDGKRGIYSAAREYLNDNKVDFILATGEPFILFRYANLLSKEFKIPWIADYRDIWSNFFEISEDYPFFRKLISRKILGFFEKKIVHNSSLITCPGVFYKEKISHLFPGKPVKIIYNGYFKEEKAPLAEFISESHKLIISYGGTIYPFQPLETFLSGFKGFIKEFSGNSECVFYGGAFNEGQKKRILNFSELSDNIRATPRIPREDLLSKYAESDFLLLFSFKKMIPGKLFDYLSVGKPILLVGADGGEMEDLIIENELGYICKTADDVKNFLADTAHLSFKENQEISLKEGVKKFSRKYQAQELSNMILDFINNNKVDDYIFLCPVCNSNKINPIRGYHSAFLGKCRECSFIFSQKEPSHEELENYYLRYSYSENYYSSPLTQLRYNQLLEKMEPFRKNNRILDVGCGNGDFLLVAKSRGWDCWGTEFSESAVSICRHKGLNVLHGSLEELTDQIPDFDIITSFEVLEHILTPAKEVRLFHQKLRPGGLLYITTPNFNSLMRKLLRGKYDVILYPEHLAYFTPLTLQKLLEDAGFKQKKMITTGFSINRLLNSLLGRNQNPFSADSIDEKFRIALESNLVFKGLKESIDKIFTYFGTGLSLKAWFEKKL